MEQPTQYRGISTPPGPHNWRTLTCRASSAPAAVRSGDVVVYDRLRCMASQYLRREGPVHPFEPSDLVHEVFVRMARSEAPPCFQTLEHFFAVCAVVMRHILIDHARSATIFNRSRRVPLETGLCCEGARSEIRWRCARPCNGWPGGASGYIGSWCCTFSRASRFRRWALPSRSPAGRLSEGGGRRWLISATNWRAHPIALRLEMESARPVAGPDRRARREIGPARWRPEQR
jgi:hypothetical protein